MDKRRDPTIARPKEKRKRGDMSHDHVRCYNRDGRKKRIYTYVQTQRKYDVQFQRLYTYLNMQNCYEQIPTSRASRGRQVFLYKVRLHYWYYSLRQSTSHPCFGVPSWTGDAFSTTTKYNSTYETSFPLRGASKVTIQTQRILLLPRKMKSILHPHHIGNVISIAWSK